MNFKFSDAPLKRALKSATEVASYSIYLAYRCAVAIVCALPLELDYELGRLLGLIGYVFAWPYRRLATANLTIAFAGEKSPYEIRALAREHFATLGANLLCSFKVASMSPQQIESRLTVEGETIMKAALAKGRGVVMVISHIGNWELFAHLTHYLPGQKTATVYQSLGNKFIDDHVKKTRARCGAVPFDRKDGFNTPIKFLREGGLVGVLVDQHAGDGGVWTPLFGRLASTSPLAATFATRTGAQLVPVAIYSAGRARWRVVCCEPIAQENLDAESLTAEINVALEKQIRISPRDWFWVHNRWKTPSPKFLLATYKRGVAYPKNFDAAILKPFRILIRSTNWLGDAVMSVPAVRAIKAGRPDARVSVLTPEKLKDFWNKVTEVDEVIAIKPRFGFSMIAEKISGRFDVVILFPNSIRAALEAWIADIPRRAGVRGKWRSALLNQMPRKKKHAEVTQPRHQVFQWLGLAEFVGADISDCGGSIAHLNPQSPIRIALCPGAEYGPAKRWLPERFAEVARIVAEKKSCEWVLVGTDKDSAIGEEISAKLDGKCTNLIGKTSLSELIEQLSQCALLLTNDTGTMHLAAFLGVPVVAIFGSTEPMLTGPLGEGHRVIRHHVECSPCFLRTCPIDFRCMNAVEVNEVADAVLELLEK
jgi:lipopolysaccharide heptosyltransferase II